jgi:outer membrane protein TolC
MNKYSVITSNKMKKLKFTRLFAIWIVMFSSNFPQGISLEEAIEMGMNSNPRIKQYSEKVAQKEYSDIEAWGNFLPKININWNYTHLNEPIAINLNPIREAMISLQSANMVEMANIFSLIQSGSPLSDIQKGGLLSQYINQLESKLPFFVENVKPRDYQSATITAVQPLFLGGKLYAAKKYSSSELNASMEELRKIENELKQEITSAYLTALLLGDVVTTRKDVLDGMNKHKNRAKRLLEEGIIANHYLFRAKVAVAEAERNLYDDNKKLELALSLLKNLIGIDDEQVITTVDSLVFRELSLKIDTLINAAYLQQPVLLMLDYKKDAADQKMVAERAKLFPTVAAFGKYELQPEYLSLLEPRWAVGLQVSLNLFNGFQDYANMQSASHLKKEVSYLIESTKKQVEIAVRKNYTELLSAKEKYRQTVHSSELAEENLRLFSRRFETGLSTSLEVIDAQLLYEKQQIDSKTILYEYYNSLNKLYTITGSPDEFINVWRMK